MNSHTPLIQAEAVLFFGVSAIVVGFLMVVLSPRWLARHGKKLSLLVLFLLTCGVAAGWAAGQTRIALGIAGLASLWLLGWLFRPGQSIPVFRAVGRVLGCHQIQAVVLVALGFTSLLGWGYWEADLPPEWTEAEQKAAIDIAPPLRALETSALTDRGHPVLVRVVTAHDPAFLSQEAEKKFLTNAGLSLRVIRLAPPSLNSNCHGWVFTGGAFWVVGEEVNRILEDNGYQAVTAPRMGDVIVYRDAFNHQALHTGVVSMLAPDGKIMVESKWGKMGRFLHLPEDQSYSSFWQFYRSTRDGHLLRNLPAQPEPTPVETSPSKLVS